MPKLFLHTLLKHLMGIYEGIKALVLWLSHNSFQQTCELYFVYMSCPLSTEADHTLQDHPAR